MAGRPTKLTPKLLEKLIGALRLGLYIEQACTYVGISAFTYHHWNKLARDGEAKYQAFAAAIELASVEAEMSALQSVRKLEERWQANMTFLERRFPARWARRVDQSGIADAPTESKQFVTVRFIKPGQVEEPSVPEDSSDDDET
jgi:hypothetical protein